MTTSRATIVPYAMIVIGLVLALLASLAVVQARGISAAPAETSIEQLQPKVGQLVFHAPPYCNANPYCAGLNVAIDRLGLQITFLVQLAVRFPRLAPIVRHVITILRAVQSSLIRIQNRRFGR